MLRSLLANFAGITSTTLRVRDVRSPDERGSSIEIEVVAWPGIRSIYRRIPARIDRTESKFPPDRFFFRRVFRSRSKRSTSECPRKKCTRMRAERIFPVPLLE